MKCIVLGAGKIARGFIGHLLYLSGIPFTFVEVSDALCDLINERGCYTVHILGCPEKDCVVSGAKALNFSRQEEITQAIADADVVFTAVGGKNLPGIVGILKNGIERKALQGGNLNIITCENWKKPADLLRSALEESVRSDAQVFLAKCVGITEAVIMRSAIESDADALKNDPLCVNVQNFWDLPVDKSRIVGELPPIQGLKLMDAFAGFLERKFYTYNAANGTVSYLGALLGFTRIADAAHDERIINILNGVYHETASALSKKHNFPLDEQLAFTETSRRKLQDYTIVDFIERNARDPIRKLGPDDRLIGSARLVLEEGFVPEHLCIAAAAAIFYEHAGDPSAEMLRQMRETQGIAAVIEKICELDPDGLLGSMIQEKVELLKTWGWIHD
ncbi:MAG: hypothetical protein VB070_05840 [Clostridiaceae bacterium]|nr:hypothetical protein [Clostridiaceae bacterium]